MKKAIKSEDKGNKNSSLKVGDSQCISHYLSISDNINKNAKLTQYTKQYLSICLFVFCLDSVSQKMTSVRVTTPKSPYLTSCRTRLDFIFLYLLPAWMTLSIVIFGPLCQRSSGLMASLCVRHVPCPLGNH